MNEGTKTGVFWCVAVVMLAIAAFVAWPSTSEQSNDTLINRDLFETFSDPLAAASLKIVTFDDERGELETFEVRKDRESGLWTIPSRASYPADAVEQMKEAANAFVGLKILDVRSDNAEDHEGFGVIEPKLEDLEIGDEGVGRMVTFKDDSQKTLASLIIGSSPSDDAAKRFVRVPGQDLVYVVDFDDAPLTTSFTKWIEDDLLKLSSIDIEDMEIRDHNASLATGQFSLTSNYDAKVKLDGTEWSLESLAEYAANDPLTPIPVDPLPSEKLDATKLNEIKNALDDLKIADVHRKPDGMSATLRANKDLLTDKDAISSLGRRGFYPIQRGTEYQLLSANGELTVGLKDGVQYVLRFGNIAGVSDGADSESAEESEGGVNRYLLVMTQVDESKFPAPALEVPPETIEDLEKMMAPQPEVNGEVSATSDTEAAATSDDPAPNDAKESQGEASEETTEEAEANTDASTDEAGDADGGEPAQETTESEEASGESESDGSGEAEGSGGGQDESAEDAADDTEKEAEGAGEDETETSAEPETTDEAPAPESEVVVKADEAGQEASEENDFASMSDEEKQELLEAEREKILKENQRKIDERNDQLADARRRVAELNARFADWYYVISEETYSKLRIDREELFAKPGATGPVPGAGGPTLPNFQVPGAPGGFPGN